ncbi:hypothetical protein BGX26_009815 [Mortierella sp. AD094]|nr:hypothetical protein BGX26_009815 [Mortierella sp. AD094]
MTENNGVNSTGPVVLIAGGGIGGLMLGTLFERLNISYHIFEQATELRALGSAMTLGSNILPVFEQLGLLEEIKEISLPCPALNVYDSNLEKLGRLNVLSEEATGYDSLIFARPQLYELMKKQVPSHKISFGKKIIGVKEMDDKVYITCADGSSHNGDLLIGADGAHSAVRQGVYKTMNELDLLPKEDLEGFYIGHICMVGVASFDDSEKYPQMKDSISHFTNVLGGDNKRWTISNIPGNRVCWSLGVQLPPSEAKIQEFRNVGWGPEANEAMLKEFEDKPCAWGGTLKDLFDATPKNLISRVFLEEKVFQTWYYGRSVLIGDACHKMLPSAGQGAINTMQDAVVLVNCLHNISEYTTENLTIAFQEYYRQRYQRTVDQVKGSNAVAKIMTGQKWSERVIRHIVLNYIPDSIHMKMTAKMASYRPQISWLPLVENRGTIPVLPQE